MNPSDWIDAFRINIESLHSSMAELVEKSAKEAEKNANEHEIFRKELRELYATAVKDGENIRALARIAETHERRLTAIEGDADVQ